MSFDLFKEFAAPEGVVQHDLTSRKNIVDEFADDDFGDFEGPDSNHNDPIAEPALGMPHGQYDHNDFKPEDHNWEISEIGTVLFDAGLEQVKPQPAKLSIRNKAVRKVEPVIPIDFDDHFDAWEPQEAVEQITNTQALKTQPESPRNPESSNTHLPSTKPAVTGSPPTNIPPPSILLSLSANLLCSLPSKLKEALHESEQPKLLALRHHLSNLRTIAHILAGRKLRWKRDNLLFQSMRIGPAGKHGGMKLTGVDKTESRREDQEAAEVLRIWRQQVGLLRSTIATLKGYVSAGGFALPEMAENMPVRQGKPGEGAVTASKACFLCGVKRDERVMKVDVDVEDSFGEWWVEHWGHVDCVVFWTDQKDRLPQR